MFADMDLYILSSLSFDFLLRCVSAINAEKFPRQAQHVLLFVCIHASRTVLKLQFRLSAVDEALCCFFFLFIAKIPYLFWICCLIILLSETCFHPQLLTTSGISIPLYSSTILQLFLCKPNSLIYFFYNISEILLRR